MERADSPDHFVSIIKTIYLKGPSDFNRLTAMGANPLSRMLGPDESWSKEMNL